MLSASVVRLISSMRFDGRKDIQPVKSPQSVLHAELKGALLCLRQFLTTESPLKMMKNVFYFTSKAHSVLKIFKFLS